MEQTVESCGSHRLNEEIHNSVHLLVNLCIFDNARYKNQYCRRTFDKCLHNKCYENPFSGCEVVLSGRTDRQDEADSRATQFCECA
jgi:hypothetical protein